MKQDKYLKIVLTIIALCLVWLSVKDVVIGPNAVYGSTQQLIPSPRDKEKEKAIQELLKRWQFMGRGVDYLEERGEFAGLIETFANLIKAGYVPRFSFGPQDILVLEKVK